MSSAAQICSYLERRFGGTAPGLSLDLITPDLSPWLPKAHAHDDRVGDVEARSWPFLPILRKEVEPATVILDNRPLERWTWTR